MSTSARKGGASSHPLGLPAGSVRAILALSVFGTAMILLVLQRPIDQNLWLANTVVLAYYFATRQHGAAAEAAGPQPLGLPRGTVRWLMILSFTAATVYLVSVWRSEGRALVEQPSFFPLLAVGSFFLGRALQVVTAGFAAHPGLVMGTVNNVKALAALISAAAVVALFLFEIKMEHALHVERVILSFIIFYFGSR